MPAKINLTKKPRSRINLKKKILADPATPVPVSRLQIEKAVAFLQDSQRGRKCLHALERFFDTSGSRSFDTMHREALEIIFLGAHHGFADSAPHLVQLATS